ncbi:DUF1611 domain-containing protein [Rhodopirellula halodulae]|uniref:DUF1611 domain-containing protein n=1 Tax=Rhodopirellula halodulae TaxID=2894198 RepID=UPI001E583EC3|nr:DUF1611 domain-containing protein [Rhodopirellula sp. JC737]MCC9657100.1 DUF1611 domain-containing protein [Rhodopirellula sp. JC737]
MLTEHRRIALLTDGASNAFLAKTAISLLRYRTSDIAVVVDREHAGKTSADLFGVGQVPVVESWSPSLDCDAIYIGIAPPGGKLPAAWKPQIEAALSQGIDVVSGLHDFLTDHAPWVQLAKQTGANLIDVRKNNWKETATGQPFREQCLRIHAVGQDCSIGKMVTTVEMDRGLRALGHDSKFLATGQTGIMISGQGVPADCVVSDFVNGAIEHLVRENDSADFLLIEGQGSISHPAYSAVTLGLLHGCVPQGLVYCYEALRKEVKGFDGCPIPPAEEQMQAIKQIAQLRGPTQFIGVSVNTRRQSAAEAALEIQRAEDRFGLPACDVYRDGADKLIHAAVQLRQELFSEQPANMQQLLSQPSLQEAER